MLGRPFEATAFFVLPGCDPGEVGRKARYVLESMGFEITYTFADERRAKVVGLLGSPTWDRILKFVFHSDVGCRSQATIVCKKEVFADQERWVFGVRASPHKSKTHWGRGLLRLRGEILDRLVAASVLNPRKHRQIEAKGRYYFAS